MQVHVHLVKAEMHSSVQYPCLPLQVGGNTVKVAIVNKLLISQFSRVT